MIGDSVFLYKFAFCFAIM